MKNKGVLFLVQAAAIAALYVVLTWIAAMMGLSSGVIQVRFSEALTILPFFTGAAIPGLFVGCILANFLSGAVFWDILFGSLATLLGALGTYALRKTKIRWLAPLPPIAANTLIVPWVLRFAYGFPDGLWYMTLTVGAGEIISCGILGMILLFALLRYQTQLFRIQ